MNENDDLNGLHWQEVTFVMKGYLEQKPLLSVDRLPYTDQIRQIAEATARKFPNRGWNEKMVYRTLITLRKQGSLPKVFRKRRADEEVAQ